LALSESGDENLGFLTPANANLLSGWAKEYEGGNKMENYLNRLSNITDTASVGT